MRRFAGMFLGSASVAGGSISENVYNQAWNSQDRGDDHNSPGYRDHGSNRHYISWWRHGALENRTWECNTWVAKSSRVS